MWILSLDFFPTTYSLFNPQHLEDGLKGRKHINVLIQKRVRREELKKKKRVKKAIMGKGLFIVMDVVF